jgi:hypothetical protein
MGRPTVVCVLLDAFRWDYVNPVDTPLLWEWCQEGCHVRQLVTTAGFSQRTAVFCGTHPDTSGTFTMFGFNPDRSPFSYARKWSLPLRMADGVIRSRVRGAGRLDRSLRTHLVQGAASRTAVEVPTGNIPLFLLPQFYLAEDERPIHEEDALEVDSIFDVLRRSGRSFRYIMYPEVNCDDDYVLELSLAAVEENHDCLLLQFSDADQHCHLHGPESAMRHHVVGEIDRKLRVLRDALHRSRSEVSWLVAGDHGMMEVSDRLDVAAIVHQRARRLGWRHGRDYLLFLDSTLARLWSLNGKTGSRLEELLADRRCEDLGGVIDGLQARSRRIPRTDRRYGDLLWQAKPGVLICPDYFHRRGEGIRGMHGYDSNHPSMRGFAVAVGRDLEPMRRESASLVDVCPTLCALAGIDPPYQNEGKNLLVVEAPNHHSGEP